MGLIDFILNFAGLLLWLNWRAAKADPLGKRKPATLLGTLRRAEPGNAERWQVPAALAALLLLRALFYWQIGSAAHWSARLDLGVIELSFRSDFLTRMLLFSLFSFLLTLAVFYLWLILLSILAGPQPIHSLVRMQLGPVDRWGRWPKIFLPLAAGALLWWLASWLLSWLTVGGAATAHFIPQSISPAHRIETSLLVGLDGYLTWKYPIAALLALHLLNSYIYFGKHPFWKYVDATVGTLLQPLLAGLRVLWRVLRTCLPRSSSLREGKANFSPVLKHAGAALLNVAGIALVFLVAEPAGQFLAWLYRRLAS